MGGSPRAAPKNTGCFSIRYIGDPTVRDYWAPSGFVHPSFLAPKIAQADFHHLVNLVPEIAPQSVINFQWMDRFIRDESTTRDDLKNKWALTRCPPPSSKLVYNMS